MTDTTAKGLTILHISDFHFKSGVQYDQDRILNELLRKISKLKGSKWHPDLILCTGDIAYSGKPTEYKLARDFFDKLLETAGIEKDRFFAVSGNHDVNWDEPSKPTNIKIEENEDSDKFFESQESLRDVLKKLSGYQEFSNEYLGQKFDENNYYSIKTIQTRGISVGIAGLNSAWPYHERLFEGSAKRGQLLGRTPVTNALEKLKDANLKIVMFHHPLHWLLEFEQSNIRNLLEGSADLVLNGHQLTENIDIYHVGTRRKLLYIQAGPAHGSGKWPNSVHLIRWEVQGNQRTATIYPLAYSPKGGRWDLDPTVFPDEEDYIGHFDMTEKPESLETDKALILSVGIGRIQTPRGVEDLAEALASSVTSNKSNKTFFLVSDESREGTLPKILERTCLQNHEYQTIITRNPYSILQTYETVQPIFEQIKRDYRHITVDFTSGTQAMAGALIVLSTIYEADSLSYLAGKKGIQELSVTQFYFAAAERKIKTAVDFFNRNQFNATTSVLTQIEEKTTDPRITSRTIPLKNLAEAYEQWDRFQHIEAFQKLGKIDNRQLDSNKRFLGQLLGTNEPEPYYIADLLNNAERRGTEEKKYDDAVARLYRTIELIAYHQLKEYEIDPSEAKPTDIPKELREKWNIKNSTPRIRIGLERAYELLNARKHPLGGKFTNDRELKHLLSKRNTSILAHNLKPVDKKTYEDLHRKTLEYAASTIRNLDQLTKDSTFIKWRE